MGFQYIVCHPLTRQQLAPPLRMTGESWTETVNGNGSFTGTIAIPDNPDARQLLALATEPDEAAIYVRDTSLNSFVWGGPIIEQEWDESKNTISITAAEWRSWLYTVFLGPKLDLSADVSYSWTNKDQLFIAEQIVGYAITGGTADGRPNIVIPTTVSGKNRDLNIKGLDFKTAGELLDSISTRSGGFEWTIDIGTNSFDGLPELRLGLYFPERGDVVSGLLFKSTAQGGNFVIKDKIKKSSSERRTRVWTTGSSETLPFAADSDPDLPDGFTLLREKSTNYSTVTERTTLASHARAERQFLNPKVNLLSIRVQESSPPVGSYRVGDRARLILENNWYSIDLDACRILSRKITPHAGAGHVELVLDLADFVLPEVDAGGVV